MTRTVCAIVPTFNRRDLVIECVQSLLDQTRPPDQIFVIDDGSTDGTAEALAPYLGRITYERKENGGKSAALNLAISKTVSDYIWICDDDDCAAQDGLARLLEALDHHPEADFAYGDFLMFTIDPTGKKVFTAPTYKPRANEANIRVRMLEDMVSFQFTFLVPRALYEKVGPFDVALKRSQDYEMSLRLSRHANAVHVPHVIFHQRHHDGERGALGDRFKAGDNQSKWLTYDQIFFKRIAETYTLAEFRPSFADLWPVDRQTRASYLERAVVMARRGLWDQAVRDIREAVGASAAELSPEEREICEIVVRKQSSWLALAAQPALCGALRDIRRGGALGRAIVMALCRPLGWMTKAALRQGHRHEALLYLRLLRQILGFRGLVLRFWLSARDRRPI